MRISVEHNPYCVGLKWEVSVEVSHKELIRNWDELRRLIEALEEAGEKAFGRNEK
jgi:hypothetical protein